MYAPLVFTLALGAAASNVPTCTHEGDTRPVDEICQDYCTGKCAFLNETTDTGKPSSIVLYRVTPVHARDPANKDFGDPIGDIGFYLGLRTGRGGRFLAGDNVIGAFNVDIDGLWNTYKMCNPNNQTADPTKPHDNFVCEYDCQTPPNCKPITQNGTAGYSHSLGCSCPSTGRDMRAVGREPSPTGLRVPSSLGPPKPPTPAGWLNCSAAMSLSGCSYTSDGHHRANLSSCLACAANVSKGVFGACGGEQGRLTAACGQSQSHTCDELLTQRTGCEPPTSVASATACYACAYAALEDDDAWERHQCETSEISELCLQGEQQWSPYHDVKLPGLWYDLPAAGACAAGTKPGDGSGCAWSASALRFINETCTNERIDAVVIGRNQPCFDACPVTNGTVDDDTCWSGCYFAGLAGNSTAQLPPLPLTTLTDIWTAAFQPPTQGGCPEIEVPETAGVEWSF